MSAPFVYEAPASCPSEADFRQRVAGWLDLPEQRAPALVSGRLHLDARSQAQGDRAYQGEASLPKSGAARDLHAATCDELVTAFAFVFAVDLDERVLDRAPPAPPRPAPAPAAAAAPVPVARASVPSAPSTRRLTWSLAALSGAEGGVLPHATPSEALELEARVRRDEEAGLVVSPRVRLGVAFDLPASAVSVGTTENLSASFYALRARVDACPAAFVQPVVDVSVCARADTNVILASGTDFTGSRSAADVLFGIGGSARVAFRLSPRWSLGVDGGLVAPVARDRFTVLGGRSFVYATSLLTESAQVVLGFGFR